MHAENDGRWEQPGDEVASNLGEDTDPTTDPSLAGDADGAEARRRQAAEAAEADKGSKCPQCGADVLEGERYCPVCNAVVVEKGFCPMCGSPVDALMSSCPDCGSPNPMYKRELKL